MNDDTDVPSEPALAGAREISGTNELSGAPRASAAQDSPGEQQPRKGGLPANSSVGKGGNQFEAARPPPPDAASGKSPAPDAGGKEPGELDKRPYLARVSAEEQDWERRQQNLRELDGEETPLRAGRDAIGGDSNRVSGGGSIFKIAGDVRFCPPAGGDRVPSIRYLRYDEAEQLRQCLVVPPSQAELKDTLARRTLIFLRGADGSGRRTAALGALLAWAQADAAAFEEGEVSRVGMITASSPFRYATPDLQKGHGYVLEATNAGNVRDLGAFAENMRDLADRRECKLIILVPSGASSLPARIVDHRPPPPPEIFRCRLEYEAACAGVEVHLLDEMRQEIDAEMLQDASPKQAADLAVRLVERLKRGEKIDDLRTELPRQLRDNIRHRLDEGKPVLGRCFMISAAVLSGLQETIVSGAALKLAEHIKNVNSIKPEEMLPAWEQLPTWLEYAAAITTPAQVAGGGRVVTIERHARIMTLRVLWEDHPTIRGPLIVWLKDLAEDVSQNDDVQTKAAHAAGILATFDFDFARSRLLDPWARSRRVRDRHSATMMLESAATLDRDILPRVRDLMRKLANGTRGERLVAADAYGSSIGLDAPGLALRDLRSIALGRDIEVSKTVAGSIGNLYSITTADEIIKELASWVAGGSLTGRYTSALAFVRLGRITKGNPACPPLIDLEPDDELFRRLATLWRNALDLRIVISGSQREELAVPDSWTVLTRWVSRYEEEHAIRAVIDKLLRVNDPGSERLRRALLLNLRKWEHQKLVSRDLCKHLITMMKGG